MILNFNIPNHGEFKLEFEDIKIQKFSMCNFWYENSEIKTQVYTDYIYIFIDNMLKRIRKVPILMQLDLFGKMGRWQEYFYYDSLCADFSNEISEMKRATFVSAEKFGSFLYEFNGEIWLEINRGYSEEWGMDPIEYYENPTNYQILITSIPMSILCKWEKKLEDINKILA